MAAITKEEKEFAQKVLSGEKILSSAEEVRLLKRILDPEGGKPSIITQKDALKLVETEKKIGAMQLHITELADGIMESEPGTKYSRYTEKDLTMMYGYLHAAWDLLSTAKYLCSCVIEEAEEKR